ncbi:MAG: hypothetical protein ACKOB4_17795, partial [Acidobacteriota bacterium]
MKKLTGDRFDGSPFSYLENGVKLPLRSTFNKIIVANQCGKRRLGEGGRKADPGARYGDSAGENRAGKGCR